MASATQRPSFVLAPTDRQVERALGRGSGFGGGAATLGGFLRDAAETLVGGEAVAELHVTRLAAARAIDAAASEGLVPAPSDEPSRARLAAAFDGAIGALRSAGTPQPSLAATSLARGIELGHVMGRVDHELARAQRMDARGLGARVATAIGEGARLDSVLRNASIVELFGFATLDGDACAALEAAHAALRAGGGAGVRVELPRFADEEDDPIAPLAEALEGRWASLADAPELVFCDVRTHAPRSVVTARDADGEARAAARAVLDALEEGAPPERIAIALPRLDDVSLAPLFAALEDARVPYRPPGGRSAIATPLGRAVLALLEIARGPVAREDVLELLRAPGLHAGVVTDRAAEREAEARATSLAHRLREVPVAIDRTGRWLVEGLARATADRPDDAWMPHALARLIELARFVAGSGSRRDFAGRLRQVFERLRLGRPSARALSAAIRAERDGGLALAALASSARTGRAVEETVAAWLDAAELLTAADEPIDAKRAAAEIELALRSAGAASAGAAAGAGAVHIGRAHELAGLEHALVVVMGLEQDAFEGEGEGGLIDEALRRALPSGLRPPPRSQISAARRAELLWAIGGAERLVFTHATGTDAEPAPPHKLVREALASDAPKRIEPLARVAPGSARIDARSRELGALSRGATAPPDVAARAAAEKARAAFFLDPRAEPSLFTGRFADTDAGRAHAARVIGGASREAPIAVTSIERAAACPFLAFSRRILRADRRDELDEAADARERGLLVHRALEAAFQAASRAPSGDAARTRELVRAATERALDLDARVAPLRREALRAAVADAMAVLDDVLASTDPVRFAFAERRFGRESDAPWSALELAGVDGALAPSVFVEGVVDRIDASTDRRRARVVDYKTGSKPPALADHGKVAFQLPIYAEVVRRALAAEHVEAHYVLVRPRAPVSIFPKREEAREAIVAGALEALAEARRVVLRAWSGDGRPRPVHATTCARCESRDVCRRPAVVPDRDD